MNATRNPLRALQSHGQSIWLDYIERRILTDGTLKAWIAADGVSGMTSNPAIFAKAMAHTDAYGEAIAALARRGLPTVEIYEHLAVEDVRSAADLFRPVYDRSGGRDGFVSLEVSPLLARDTDATVREARRLWTLLDRPNVMIKVPGTREGLPAVRLLIGEGININVTLLFSVARYADALDAYLRGVEDRLAAGRPVERVVSVASFFLSRIDAKIDPLLDAIAAGADPDRADAAEALRGQAATASAGAAYGKFQEVCRTERWKSLANRGVSPQRPLWASTSTKDPVYSDVKYVEALIGPDTVNTVPIETLEAYRSHGEPAPRLLQTSMGAAANLQGLAALGIDIEAIDEVLEREGVAKFADAYDKLLEILEGLR